VQTALTDIGEKKAQWAADADESYRFATHRILLGVFDKSANAAGAMDSGSLTPGAPAPATPVPGLTPVTPEPSATPAPGTPAR